MHVKPESLALVESWERIASRAGGPRGRSFVVGTGRKRQSLCLASSGSIDSRRAGSGPPAEECTVAEKPAPVRRQVDKLPGFITRASMRAVFYVIDLALVLYIWVLIAAVAFSWLVALNMVNTRNQAIAMIGESLDRITEPVLRPIRNAVPKLGGIDISPFILFLIIMFIRYVIALYILPYVY